MVYSVTLMNPIAEADDEWPNDFLWEVWVGALPSKEAPPWPSSAISGGSHAGTSSTSGSSSSSSSSSSSNGRGSDGGGGSEGSGQRGEVASCTKAVRVATKGVDTDLAVSSNDEKEEEEEGGKDGSSGSVSGDGSDVEIMPDDGDVEDVSADDDDGDSSDNNDGDEAGGGDKEESLSSPEGEDDAVDGGSEANACKISCAGTGVAVDDMSVSGKDDDDAKISSDDGEGEESTEDELIERRRMKNSSTMAAEMPTTDSKPEAPSSVKDAGGQHPQPVAEVVAPPCSPPPRSPSPSRPSPGDSLASLTSPGATSIDIDDDSGTDSSFDESEEDSEASSDEDMEDDDGDEYEVDVPCPPCSVLHKERKTFKHSLCETCYYKYKIDLEAAGLDMSDVDSECGKRRRKKPAARHRRSHGDVKTDSVGERLIAEKKHTRNTRRSRPAGSPNGDRKKRRKTVSPGGTVSGAGAQSNGKPCLRKGRAPSMAASVKRKAPKQRRRLRRSEDDMPELEDSSPEHAMLSDTSFSSNGSGNNDDEGIRPSEKLPRGGKQRASTHCIPKKSAHAASVDLTRADAISTKRSGAKGGEMGSTTIFSKGRDGNKDIGGIAKGASSSGGRGGDDGGDGVVRSVTGVNLAAKQGAQTTLQDGGRHMDLKKGRSDNAWHAEPNVGRGSAGRGDQKHGPQRQHGGHGGPLPDGGKSSKCAGLGVTGDAEKARASSKITTKSKVRPAGKAATESRPGERRARGGSFSHDESNKVGKKDKTCGEESEGVSAPATTTLTTSKVGYEKIVHYYGVRRKNSNDKFFLWVNDKLHDGTPYDSADECAREYDKLMKGRPRGAYRPKLNFGDARAPSHVETANLTALSSVKGSRIGKMTSAYGSNSNAALRKVKNTPFFAPAESVRKVRRNVPRSEPRVTNISAPRRAVQSRQESSTVVTPRLEAQVRREAVSVSPAAAPRSWPSSESRVVPSTLQQPTTARANQSMPTLATEGVSRESHMRGAPVSSRAAPRHAPFFAQAVSPATKPLPAPPIVDSYSVPKAQIDLPMLRNSASSANSRSSFTPSAGTKIRWSTPIHSFHYPDDPEKKNSDTKTSDKKESDKESDEKDLDKKGSDKKELDNKGQLEKGALPRRSALRGGREHSQRCMPCSATASSTTGTHGVGAAPSEGCDSPVAHSGQPVPNRHEENTGVVAIELEHSTGEDTAVGDTSVKGVAVVGTAEQACGFVAERSSSPGIVEMTAVTSPVVPSPGSLDDAVPRMPGLEPILSTPSAPSTPLSSSELALPDIGPAPATTTPAPLEVTPAGMQVATSVRTGEEDLVPMAPTRFTNSAEIARVSMENKALMDLVSANHEHNSSPDERATAHGGHAEDNRDDVNNARGSEEECTTGDRDVETVPLRDHLAHVRHANALQEKQSSRGQEEMGQEILNFMMNGGGGGTDNQAECSDPENAHDVTVGGNGDATVANGQGHSVYSDAESEVKVGCGSDGDGGCARGAGQVDGASEDTSGSPIVHVEEGVACDGDNASGNVDPEEYEKWFATTLQKLGLTAAADKVLRPITAASEDPTQSVIGVVATRLPATACADDAEKEGKTIMDIPQHPVALDPPTSLAINADVGMQSGPELAASPLPTQSPIVQVTWRVPAKLVCRAGNNTIQAPPQAARQWVRPRAIMGASSVAPPNTDLPPGNAQLLVDGGRPEAESLPSWFANQTSVPRTYEPTPTSGMMTEQMAWRAPGCISPVVRRPIPALPLGDSSVDPLHQSENKQEAGLQPPSTVDAERVGSDDAPSTAVLASDTTPPRLVAWRRPNQISGLPPSTFHNQLQTQEVLPAAIGNDRRPSDIQDDTSHEQLQPQQRLPHISNEGEKVKDDSGMEINAPVAENRGESVADVARDGRQPQSNGGAHVAEGGVDNGIQKRNAVCGGNTGSQAATSHRRRSRSRSPVTSRSTDNRSSSSSSMQRRGYREDSDSRPPRDHTRGYRGSRHDHDNNRWGGSRSSLDRYNQSSLDRYRSKDNDSRKEGREYHSGSSSREHYGRERAGKGGGSDRRREQSSRNAAYERRRSPDEHGDYYTGRSRRGRSRSPPRDRRR